MTAGHVRVGIIGADARASWAKVSHIPAIEGLVGLELAAVATRREESAREAADVFGAPRWFDDPFAMVRDDDIDLVTIAVKVPDHRALVLAALEAGKAVYCESPLGTSSKEAEEMAHAATSKHVAIGLQARFDPAVRRAAQLVSEGSLGRLLSARVVSTSSGFGPITATPYLYFEASASGANLLTITAGHTLDVVEAVLGRITEVDARAPTLWPKPTVYDTGSSATREVPDHLDVLGLTNSGAILAATVLGGIAPEQARFEFEVRGSDGWLKLTGGHPYGFQAGTLELTASVAFDQPEPSVVSGGLLNAASNVGEVYASLARDIRSGEFKTLGFDHAVWNSRLIESIWRAGQGGSRQHV